MADIDVDQWRNAQSLLLSSAKAARRLVVIHERGTVVKFRHTDAVECSGRIDIVADPHRLARELYEANREKVDFVVVMERHAVDSYFAQVQNSWNIDEDLDEYVQRTYAAFDDFPDGIVTYPGPARQVMGLQWNTGVSLTELNASVAAMVPPETTVVLGVHEEEKLWASLVLDFDAQHKVTSITTADPSVVSTSGTREAVADALVSWQWSAGKRVSACLVLDRDQAEPFLKAVARDKASQLVDLVAADKATLRL
jgi:hypothetical protein